jgi:hypothetical protein
LIRGLSATDERRIEAAYSEWRRRAAAGERRHKVDWRNYSLSDDEVVEEAAEPEKAKPTAEEPVAKDVASVPVPGEIVPADPVPAVEAKPVSDDPIHAVETKPVPTVEAKPVPDEPIPIPITPAPNPFPNPGPRSTAQLPHCYHQDVVVSIDADSSITYINAYVIRSYDNQVWSGAAAGNTLSITASSDSGEYYLKLTLSDGQSYQGKYIIE